MNFFSRYRPDLIDFHTLDAKESVDNLQFAFDLLEQELGMVSHEISIMIKN